MNFLKDFREEATVGGTGGVISGPDSGTEGAEEEETSLGLFFTCWDLFLGGTILISSSTVKACS